MAEALYRKYRPQVFGDVVGQEHIERTIKNAIEHDKVSHAYLFTGPRGTGKTTTARLLAKALMCEKGPTPEPDGTCQDCIDIANGVHPDVYELDAASRTGVDNVREEIIGRVQFAPTRGRYKVYIIDEVHMLSTAAFNALLKTLEEPPSHVVFILCTTDPQKVPETIHSRCQRFDFHRISNEDIVARLGAVCGEEGVEFDPEALELIAYRAEGGMRNALTSLEQLIAFGGDKVTLDVAERMLGSMDSDDLSGLVDALAASDASACFNLTSNLVEDGTDLAQYTRDLAEYVRDLYLMSLVGVDVDLGITRDRRASMEGQVKKFGPDRLSNLLGVLGDLSKELRVSTNPRLSFEIALTRMLRPESDLTLSALSQRVEQLERALASGAFVAPASAPAQAPSAPTVAAPSARAASAPVAEAPAAGPALAAPAAAPASSAGFGASAVPAAVGFAPAPMSAASGTSAVPAMGSPRRSEVSPSSAPVATSHSAGSRSHAAPGQVPSSGIQGRHQSAAQLSGRPGPAPVEGSQPTASVTAVSGPSSTAAPADVDISNPANLQRLWRAVTTTLRKANPARGVLFLNAKVSASPAGSVQVGFSSENSFAFNAASKPEVVQLLAQTIEQVAGGSVPFELVMLDSSGAPTGMPRGAGTLSSAPAGQSRPPRQTAAVPAVPAASSVLSAPVVPAVPPAGAAKVTPPSFGSQSTPAARTESVASGASVTASSSVGSSSRIPTVSTAATSSAVSSPHAPTAPTLAVPVPPERDDVPLDMYESYASSYEDSDYESQPAPSVEQARGVVSAPSSGSFAAKAPVAQTGSASGANGSHVGASSASRPQSSARPAVPSSSAVSGSGRSPQGGAPNSASSDDGSEGLGIDAMEQLFNDAFGGQVRFTDLD